MEKVSLEDSARADTVIDLMTGFVRLANDILELHGNDPESTNILAAGFLGAIVKIDEVAPNSKFMETVAGALLVKLSENKPRKYDA